METIAISKTPDKKQNSFHDHSMTCFIELFFYKACAFAIACKSTSKLNTSGIFKRKIKVNESSARRSSFCS